MPLPRLIPCLDVADGRVVKGVKFQGLRDVGDPVELGAAYSDAGADELVFLDIAATVDSGVAAVDVAARVAEQVTIPFTFGGGIRTLGDAHAVLEAGGGKGGGGTPPPPPPPPLPGAGGGPRAPT